MKKNNWRYESTYLFKPYEKFKSKASIFGDKTAIIPIKIVKLLKKVNSPFLI